MSKAQAFTLEGIIASLLLLLVTFTIFQSSLVVNPMWSELTDVQLRLLAYDALKVLDNSSKVDGKYLNDSLQGLITNLDEDFTANQDFVKTLEKLVFPASYMLEICWIENDEIVCVPVVKNKPTPEAVMGSRYIVLPKSDLPQVFLNTSDPVVFEVRLVLWRP